MSTFAGTPQQSGFKGDGQLALTAKLYYPVGVYEDALGNITVADQYNFRVRQVTAFAGLGASVNNLSFPLTNVGSTSSPFTVTLSGVGTVSILSLIKLPGPLFEWTIVLPACPTDRIAPWRFSTNPRPRDLNREASLYRTTDSSIPRPPSPFPAPGRPSPLPQPSGFRQPGGEDHQCAADSDGQEYRHGGDHHADHCTQRNHRLRHFRQYLPGVGLDPGGRG